MTHRKVENWNVIKSEPSHKALLAELCPLVFIPGGTEEPWKVCEQGS